MMRRWLVGVLCAVSLGLPASGWAVSGSIYTYFNVPAAGTTTTTVIKSGTGQLHTITINIKGTGASRLRCYDNATVGSGPVIATIDTTGYTGTLIYDVVFAKGLTCVNAVIWTFSPTVSTAPTSADYTVSYE